MTDVVTREEARERFRRAGKTISEFAREMDVSHKVVRRVLSGRLKGEWGDAHRVAVTLGLKDGFVAPDDMPIAEALRRSGRH